MDIVSTLLPQTPGLLPKALFVVGIISLANTLQAILTESYTKRIYNRTPPDTKQQQVTALSRRTFAVWTALSGLIRLYASFHIEDVHVYRLTLLTFLMAGAHFAGEVFAFRSAGLDGVVKAPLAFAGTMMVWMWVVQGAYVEG